MPPTTTPAGAAGWMSRLGPKLRQLRKDRNLTLQTVADRAGLTKGFLSLVERGQTTISVPNLLKICEILGVGVGSLFDYPGSDVVRGGADAPVDMGGSGISEFVLTPATERHLQVMRTVLQPGGGTGGAYSLDSETVFAFVLRGSLRITVDGHESMLETDDCYTFSPRAPHCWDNPGTAETEVLWAIVPPIAPAGTG